MKLLREAIKPALAMFLLIVAAGFSREIVANEPPWPLAPTSAMTAQPMCERTEDVIWVWLPRQDATTTKAMLQRWPEHPLAPLSGCLQYRYYSDVQHLQCRTAGERQHVRCDLPLLPRELLQRHIVFTDAPIGSASPQQIVLAKTAELTVFAHEIAHWLGFADEYQMAPSLASDYCHGRYQHPSLNVVVTRQQRLSAQELQQLWRRLPWREAVTDWRLLGRKEQNGSYLLGSAKDIRVGLFPAKTCAGVNGVFSWKPVARFTAMEYHDVNYWPDIYLRVARTLQRRGGLRDHNDRAQ